MARQRPIKVLIADDHTMFRQGLGEMLSTDGEVEVIGEAENGVEAISQARAKEPDVVVLDVEMPVMGAHETLERLLGISPAPRVVIVTMFEDPRLVRELLRKGASAYLVKSASLQELLSAVHAAAEGPQEENVTLSVPRGVMERAEKGAGSELSGRELEVLLLAARGLSNRQAATVLQLSEATIKRHLANIYSKLDVASRGEASRKALAEGWITARDLTRS